MNWDLNCYTDVVLETPLIGDKIKLPSEILSQIIERDRVLNINNMEQNEDSNETSEMNQMSGSDETLKFPITFMIRNEKANKNFAVSVLDFNSESNMMYVPDWIFHNLYPIEFGDMISVSLYSGGTSEKNIPKGTYVKFRPHNYEFLQLSNHKEILEKELKNYGLLNKHTTITFEYFSLQFNLDIIDLEPDNIVDIINTDINVDFEPPIDYIEPKPEEKKELEKPEEQEKLEETKVEKHDENIKDIKEKTETDTFVAFSGKGYRLGDK